MRNFSRFYHAVDNVLSCREGTDGLEKSIAAIQRKRSGREEDIDLLWSIQSRMKETPFVH
jgi:NADH:ubiquinone oxidoreductase subunit F (NADH-binding)